MAENSEGRKKRGSYKSYDLNPNDENYNPVVPKTTKWRRLQVEPCDNEDLYDDFEGYGSEEDLINRENTFGLFDVQNEQENIYPDDNEECEFECPQEEIHESNASENEKEFEHSDLDEPLYDNAPVSVGQCLLLFMAFILGNNLTSVAVGNLLRLLTMILPIGSRLPHTRYLFNKYFNGLKEGLEYKLFCSSCKTLLEDADDLKCTICEAEYQRQQLLEQGHFFIYLPLEKQLQDFVHTNDISSDLYHRFNREENDLIDDIYDGQMYQSLGNGTLTTDRNAEYFF